MQACSQHPYEDGVESKTCVRACVRVFLFPPSRCVKQRRLCCDEVNGGESAAGQVQPASVAKHAATKQVPRHGGSTW